MAQKWPKMTQNAPKWPKYDPKWPKMVQHGPRMTQNDPKWPKNDPTWPKITPNGPNMTPGFMHFFRNFVYRKNGSANFFAGMIVWMPQYFNISPQHKYLDLILGKINISGSQKRKDGAQKT